jgi:hypothetical protein
MSLTRVSTAMLMKVARPVMEISESSSRAMASDASLEAVQRANCSLNKTEKS